jgi:hypothetical protein
MTIHSPHLNALVVLEFQFLGMEMESDFVLNQTNPKILCENEVGFTCVTENSLGAGCYSCIEH